MSISSVFTLLYRLPTHLYPTLLIIPILTRYSTKDHHENQAHLLDICSLHLSLNHGYHLLHQPPYLVCQSLGQWQLDDPPSLYQVTQPI